MGFWTEDGFVCDYERISGEPIPGYISAKWHDVENRIKGLINTYKLLETEKLDILQVFERNILLVVELFLLKENPIYRLLFSTDTKQSPNDVIDIYHTCFQIEFGFRNSKHFAGLENSQARGKISLIFISIRT